MAIYFLKTDTISKTKLMKNYFFLFILILSNSIVLSQTKNGNVIQAIGCSFGYIYVDNDRDGYGGGNPICANLAVPGVNYSTLGGDCNDNDPSILRFQIWYLDADRDGFGGTPTPTKLCVPPSSLYIATGGDCDDDDAAINPNSKWFLDADGDTFGNPNISLVQCARPAGYVLNNTDCNDSDATVNPSTIWYQDLDGDTYGNPAVTKIQCTQPVGYVRNNKDCNDNNYALNIQLYTWYSDADGDGFGDPNNTVQACEKPLNYVGWAKDMWDECPTVSGPVRGCIVPPTNTSFGANQNYILTIVPKIGVNELSEVTNSNDVTNTITYFDGLGRPIQNIANAQSNSSKDIITHIEYDALGRQAKEFLPYKSEQNSMSFIDKTIAATSTINYYQTNYGDDKPFSEKVFDNSPLNLVVKQAAPGTAWAIGSGHEIKFDYDTNKTGEVKFIEANASWNATQELFNTAISSTTNYPAGELTKTVTKSEDWNPATPKRGVTEEFKDKEGRVVLKRTYNGTDTLDTYYVYDQYSNLTYVIPPLAEGRIDLATLDGLCYQYKYDHRNRLVEKKLPGKQWEFIVYDKLDRPVATGPAFAPFTNLAGTTGWMITKYDAFSRPVVTAWQPATVGSAQRKALQSDYNTATLLNEVKTTTSTSVNAVAFNYTSQVLPTTGYHVLTVNYYDDYNFPSASPIPTSVEGQNVYYNATKKPIGLATGSWVRVLETTALTNAEKGITFYDEKARPIQVLLQNHLGGFTQTDTKLDFSGKALYTINKHKKDTGGTSPLLVTKQEFTYSAQNRLVKTTHESISPAAPKQTLSIAIYDELGQLITKQVGGTATSLQKVDYKYNIRGWLKEINNVDTLLDGTNPKDLFAFKINYNDNPTTGLLPQEIAVTPLYNGNISETIWRTASGDKKQKYGYLYDDLNRLTEGLYQDPSATMVTKSFDEKLTYDKNGNIKTLNRNDYMPAGSYNIEIDNLRYDYDTNNPNQLVKVTDSSSHSGGFKDGINFVEDYSYDANGNMKTDLNKGIAGIDYNHLNLPFKINFGATGTIEYIYNAVGKKIEKKVTQNTPAPTTTTFTTYLDGGYQYTNGNLDLSPTAEGYIKYNSGAIGYYAYNYTDHLGNIRVSYADLDGNGTITPSTELLEESHYYPFGLKHKPTVTSINLQPSYKYKYNGKELQDELGLNMYAMDMRQYDPAIGRWIVQDPVVHHDVSPYVAFNNNPVYFADPDGRDPITNTVSRTTITSHIDADGNTLVSMRQHSTTTVTYDDGSKTVTNTLTTTTNVINNIEGDKNNIQYSSSSNVSSQTTSFNSKGEITSKSSISRETKPLKYDSDNGVLRAWTNHIANYNRNNGTQQTWNDMVIKDGNSATKSALGVGPALLFGRVGVADFPGGQKGKGAAGVGIYELLDWSSKKIDSTNKQLILSNQDKVDGSPFNLHRNPPKVSTEQQVIKTTSTFFDRIKNMLGF
ncbi:MAG: DUF6443 domain-containing protein [Limnohabitans sp.]|nr:DUF6443 domain-containing protein [Limnohabitans sp.]